MLNIDELLPRCKAGQRIGGMRVIDGDSDSSESDDGGYHVVGRFGDTVFC